MACASAAAGGCGSGCYKDKDDEEEQQQQKQKNEKEVLGGRGRGGVGGGRGVGHGHSLCIKCKVDEALSLSSTITNTSSSSSSSNLCLGCFRSSLFAKFKQSISSHDLISPTDNVLVAFSGGPSSRVALQFVHELQDKAQRNSEASRDNSYPVFGVGVAFIDESNISAIPSHELDKAFQDLRLIVSSLAPPQKELHVMPIGNICSSDPKEGRNRVKELLDTVTDITGKEDLLQHFRMLCLQKIAFDNGYNKLVLGSSTSTIACHIISATVKGQGYSLPADIQYVDARWEIPVVLPLRDCVAQELKMLCRLDGLKTLELLDGPRSGINGLVSSFIELLQEENPSRERTIVRTAEKLTPFHFNRLPEGMNDSNDHFPSRWRRRKRLNLKSDESMPSEFLCPICCSPLNKSDVESLTNKLGSCETSSEIFGLSCCPSCQFQILPKEVSSMMQFYSHLPQPMIARAKDCLNGDQTWLRERIEDCLLSDNEDGT
ncbi:Thiouridylase [Macleaya cordata]|uniref:Cytoplasmic tRNA 2-thiolation protein 2 n=1 Tax=Macleaya cordata TaxID=56857 RepID=A0A200R6K0_MACCD|nr:Thiouridylase [Macleaya cordata]